MKCRLYVSQELKCEYNGCCMYFEKECTIPFIPPVGMTILYANKDEKDPDNIEVTSVLWDMRTKVLSIYGDLDYSPVLFREAVAFIKAMYEEGWVYEDAACLLIDSPLYNKEEADKCRALRKTKH
jgi:hypothetical protein